MLRSPLYFLLSSLAALLLFPIVFFLRGAEKKRVDLSSMNDKVVIVTGSNTGIGKQMARKLFASGATVILACRDEAKGQEAIQDIQKSISSSSEKARAGKLVFFKLDLSDLASVVQFVKRFNDKYTRLDVLINNAGVNVPGTTKNGLQQLFQVNYLSHFLLVNLLIQTSNLRKDGEEPLRVVNLSSTMHHRGNIDFRKTAELVSNTKIPIKAYDNSKLYLNLLTLQLNRSFSHDLIANNLPSQVLSSKRVVSVCVNPGAVASDIWRYWTPFVQRALKIISFVLFLNTDEGSETALFAATATHTQIRQALAPYSYSAYMNKQKKTERVCSGHELIPYVIPYTTLSISSLFLFDILGPFAGPRFFACSVPLQVDLVAVDLWNYSAELCESKLKDVGVTVKLLRV